MSKTRISVWAAGLVAIGLAGPAAYAADATNQQLQQKIDALQAQVTQLQVQQQQPQQQQQSTARQNDDKAVMQKIAADADSQSNLMDVSTPITAGWNAQKWQFFIASDDGNFYFHPGFYSQTRYAADHVRSPDTWTNGFEIRRAKFYFDGNVISKDITYKFQWQDSNPGGAPTLEYGFVQDVFAHQVFGTEGNVGVKVGQFKNYAFKEDAIVGDTNQPLIERSLANSLVGGNALGGSITEGVDLVYTGDKTPVHLDTMFTNGDASGLTSFTDVTANGKTNFGLAVRADWKLMGNWSDNYDLSGFNAKDDFFDVGAGLDWSQGSIISPAGSPGSSSVRGEIDATYVHAKTWSLFASLMGDNFHALHVAATPHNRSDAAALIEGGYFLDPALQLVARYDVSFFDNKFKTAGQDTFHEIGVGANWYLGDNGSAGNHLKVSFDCDYLPKGTPAQAGLDYVAAPAGHDSIALRGQFQIYF